MGGFKTKSGSEKRQTPWQHQVTSTATRQPRQEGKIMSESRQQALQLILLQLLPADHTTVGNITLVSQFQAAALAAGIASVTEDDFKTARELLVASGQAIKGKGRGGATARATGTIRPEFELKAESVTADLLATAPNAAPAKPGKPKAPAQATPPGAPQVLSYRHADKRKNNPEVGLVNETSDPEQAKTPWAYDPHLDPALQFDSARAGAEQLIDDALAGNDPAAMRHALETLRRMSAPYLQWTGKSERTSFEVDTVSLHVHERIDAMSILSAVSKRQGAIKKGATHAGGTGAAGQKGLNSALNHSQGFQPGLFEAPFESLPLRSAVDFYKHDRGWANRLVAGDSLLVMNSLLQKEGMAGRVQMIYIDPPYGIKYGSNFQPFTNKRDVKDRSDADLTQEPEMIKAFRDTWELGIHSYLTYLRDRLLLAKDLLSETGSVFVQISDENLHHVRELCDEVFGSDNFILIVAVRKTTGETSGFLSVTCDFLVWYGKSKKQTKFNSLFLEKSDEAESRYNQIDKLRPIEAGLYRLDDVTSARAPNEGDLVSTEVQGVNYTSGKRTFRTDAKGLRRVHYANRLVGNGSTLAYKHFLDDFTAAPIGNLWTDISGAVQSRSDPKVYVVQTGAPMIERCMLMCTDPGDLVLDPTCGSGTTAYVAEKWGRRWITCDTSRVAITLAKQRLMTASFDYFALRYPHEGLKGGFIYKTVPHVTLKSIANNPEIDAIYERLHPGIEAALAGLNDELHGLPRFARNDGVPISLTVTEGARKGQKLALGQKGVALLEWEVPFDFPQDWPADRQTPDALTGPLVDAFTAFHTARQKMQAEMDRSIAAQADNETLYDQPEKTKNKLRVTGPFTVEAVPFPTVLSLEEHSAQAPQGLEANLADMSVARSGNTSRQHSWRDELLKAGIRGKGGQMLKFAELEVLPGTTCLHASGHLDSGERVVISFGPEHGALEQRQVEHALGEAGELFPRPKMIVFCAFAFDPEAAKDIDALKGITALKAQMNTDLLTEDLKKAKSKSTTNQSFWLMGQPDVQVSPLADGLWQVEVNGFDYFDTSKGELVSGGKAKIAAWSLDTDYDGRSLFPHQFFFPMAGKDEGWMKLKKDIRAELDEDLLKHFVGTVSLPFEAGANNTVAVKIVDDRGIESLKIMRLEK
jgi:adenine-specific DNA-methyltransferase